MTTVTDTVTGESVEAMTTGEVGERLGCEVTNPDGSVTKTKWPVPAEILKSRGIRPVPAKGAGIYWRTSDFQAICEAIVGHVLSKL